MRSQQMSYGNPLYGNGCRSYVTYRGSVWTARANPRPRVHRHRRKVADDRPFRVPVRYRSWVASGALSPGLITRTASEIVYANNILRLHGALVSTFYIRFLRPLPRVVFRKFGTVETLDSRGERKRENSKIDLRIFKQGNFFFIVSLIFECIHVVLGRYCPGRFDTVEGIIFRGDVHHGW